MTESPKPAPEYSSKLEILAKSLLDDKCLIFLGAGASRGDSGESSLPTANELGVAMAEKCHQNFPPYLPLSTIAFYFESRYNRAYLNDFLKDKIDRDDIPIPATITELVAIIQFLEKRGKQCFVITTNYDCLFERAYEAATKTKAVVITYRGGWDPHDRAAQLHVGLDAPPEFWHPRRKQVTLYKMHGCIKDVDDTTKNKPCLVITDEDYINFITNALSQDDGKRILQHARGAIALSNILFLGYSLSDSNFRVVFKATAESYKNDSYAIQYLNGQAADFGEFDRMRWVNTRDFWQKKSVQIIEAKASVFVEFLLGQLQQQAGSNGG